ncbi:seryl-tRNA synthetase [Sphingobium fontiphilum]|uniref:Seryl-tRNA synthetase n=1 Tax=Sphingobium fontiphilum TaxID=944425 RepID=A0A7W6GM65_9SPHN|nr:hypothetical protein [Sphingobium fontiphilum]MBB3980896.1 seryl-tRNA synthetase [Sphingobium fontiphilum]
MSGGSTIVEFWRDEQSAAPQGARGDDILLLNQAVLDIGDDEGMNGVSARFVARLRWTIAALAVAWLGFCVWAYGVATPLTAASDLPGAVATLSAPLIMLGVGYLLLARNSRAESGRYLDTARAMRTEGDLLELRLGRIADQLEAARQTMQDQAALLDNYGAAASSNMEASAELLAARAAETAERAASAQRATDALAARMDALVAAMPDLEDRAVRMGTQLADNGHALSERLDTLEARLTALTELSDEARSRTLSATKSLTVQLKQLQEETRAASEEVTGLSDLASGRIDLALRGAREAISVTSEGLTDQSDRLEALLERARTQIAAISADATDGADGQMTELETRLTVLLDRARSDVAAIATDASDGAAGQMNELESRLHALLDRARTEVAAIAAASADSADGQMRVAEVRLEALLDRARTEVTAIGTQAVNGAVEQMGEVEGRLLQLNALVEGQQALVSGLNETLIDRVESAEHRFASFEAEAMARAGRLTDAMGRLTAETMRIDAALAQGGLTAEKLIGCAEGLLVALDSSVRELDETYPAALERFDGRIGDTRNLLTAMTPEFERLEAISESLAGRAEESEGLIRGQAERLDHWLADTQRSVAASLQRVDELRAGLDEAHASSTRITESAGPMLVTALLRVKDTADQAAERARQALSRAIPEAAQALSDTSGQALQQAIGQHVAEQIAKVATVAEEAVKAAQQASERLGRQLSAIDQASAAIEQRIDEHERASEGRERDNFARRSAQLIESLNSTAIDVAKILSNDVTDSSWSAYLKGDRGVFTRRAVKLLDAGESREIALHYDADPEFREHVNRYIHDFEAMLRIILAARDGNTLGVAILSSDMGKLYVALAQAIERLRQ